ncbi:SRPBCC domain-containing protein [Streptomyces sp. NPDC059247]|uniref:SRPBCC family protein n=1 Tax=Streptomyces sp. NPDC059247 TaxID=3346790 RepID=UPI00368501E4
MTTPPTPMDTVTLERRIDARPEAVFAFLTDREKWLSWMGEDGVFSIAPGGSYRVRVPGGAVASGRFAVVEPPRRMVLSWGWESGPVSVPPGGSTVEITLAPAPGGTLLRLVHSGLPTTEACEAQAESWQHHIDRLASLSEGHDPGPDPWTDRPAV